MTSKKLIVFAYYKYLLEKRTMELNQIESNNSIEKLRANITHSDLNRLHQLKIINKEVYDTIFPLLSTHG